MAEPIFERVYRILNARVEDAFDRMERSGSDSVMREAIRAPSPSACVKQSQRVASGVAILVQWRMEAQRQQANAIRAEKIGNYQLGAEPAERYDDCLDISYFSTLAKVSTAFVDCAEDQRHSFASPAALNTWCGGKPDRVAGFRCQHR